MGKEIKMEDFISQTVKDMSETILSYSDDLISKRNTFIQSINKLDNLIEEIDKAEPKYIEHILRRDSLIVMKSKLISILNTFDAKTSEITKSVPLKFRIFHLFKNLFK